MTAVVEAGDLTKVFRDFWHRPKVRAVNGLTFEVQRGEVLGLLGPNGSGKTTTLKMILGLLYPTRGYLRVLGRSPRNVKAKALIGYLAEESCLYPYLTCEETLDFYGKLFDLSRRERKQRTEQLLEMIGLQHARRRMVGELSKGMARRIGLAQALINDPELVVLDEPTAGLDPLGCRQVKDLILTLAGRGKTIILSSHLLADVEDVCDRVAILYNGRVQALGPIHDLLEQKTRHTLTLPEVSPEVMKRVLTMVREAVGEEPCVEHPRMNLEQFFLDVVEKARSSATKQTGAGKSGRLAGYLTEKKKTEPGAILDHLVEHDTTQTKDEKERSTPEPATDTPRPPSAAETDEKLSKLVDQNSPDSTRETD